MTAGERLVNEVDFGGSREAAAAMTYAVAVTSLLTRLSYISITRRS